MAELKRFHADEPVESIVDALNAEGAVVVEQLIDRETIDALNDEVHEHIEAADPEREHLNPAIAFFFGKHTRHVSGVAGKSRTFAGEVMIHPTLMAICDRVLLPGCARYQLNLGHIIDRGPGTERQMFHRDELVWVHVPKPHPELQVATMIALEDFSEEIGATNIVPGSHKWEPEREPLPVDVAVAEMSAGSAAIYLGTTLHAGGANTTKDRWRRGLHTSWIAGWLRSEENNILACPPEVARTLPRPAQEMLGYAVHDALQSGGGYCGMLDLRDPCDMLADGTLR
jgi:ectoine hydroxylase-related dioxygenase (phytanoyl-CoA dioxygenase family)